jgi:hypothetical protein
MIRGAAAMPEVADWLEKLGLGQYAQRFAENDISFSILSDLTDQDLEKIGVASLGHRRLLLREIANLGKTADAAPSAASLHAPPIIVSTVTSPAEARGERRHVTVMFCDLVDSTGFRSTIFCERRRLIHQM